MKDLLVQKRKWWFLVNKKGITPQIATILLVALVIAILVIVFLWGRKYIEERALKHGKLSEKQLECEQLEITVVSLSETGTGEARIVLKNLKNNKIDRFVFRANGEIGEAHTSTDALDGLQIKEYLLSFSEDVGDLKSVDVFPHLRVAPRVYVPCSTKKVSANV